MFAVDSVGWYSISLVERVYVICPAVTKPLTPFLVAGNPIVPIDGVTPGSSIWFPAAAGLQTLSLSELRLHPDAPQYYKERIEQIFPFEIIVVIESWINLKL